MYSEIDNIVQLFTSQNPVDVELAFQLEASLYLDLSKFWNQIQTHYILYFGQHSDWQDISNIAPDKFKELKNKWLHYLKKEPIKHKSGVSITFWSSSAQLEMVGNPYIKDIYALTLTFLWDSRQTHDLSWIQHYPTIHTLRIVNFTETELPDSLQTLPNVTQFTCSGKKLRQFPEWIPQWKKLWHLDLSGTAIDTIPATLTYLRKLRCLWLKDTAITQWEPLFDKMLRYMPNVRELAWGNNLFWRLGRPFHECRYFSMRQGYTISQYDTDTFFSLFKSLTTLRSVTIGNAGLTQLSSDFIRHTSKITHLNLWQNAIETLPDDFKLYQKLTTLNLSGNRLKELPEAVRHLKKLCVLRLNNTNITTLPDWIGELTNLEELHLNGSPINTLPDNLQHCTQLRVLGMSDSQMQQIPDVIWKITSLKQLNLSNNQITTLPNDLGNLQNLVDLNIDNNPKLTTLPDSIKQLQKLSYLRICHNYKLNWHQVFSIVGHLNLSTLYWQNKHHLGNWYFSFSLKGYGQELKIPEAVWIALQYFPQKQELFLSGFTTMPHDFDWEKHLPNLKTLHLQYSFYTEDRQNYQVPLSLLNIKHPLRVVLHPFDKVRITPEFESHPFITLVDHYNHYKR